MLLAGDVGGTKTLIGLFGPRQPRPEPVLTRAYRTLDFGSLAAIMRRFVADAAVDAHTIDAACFGVAGPVAGTRARLTNVPWLVDTEEIGRELKRSRIELLNDLEALAWSVPILEPPELAVLAAGESDDRGGAALLAAGTGLGVALLPRVNGGWAPTPSEGGHVDFAPRTPDEQRLHAGLTREYGRAELERVLSGPGIVNIHRFVHPHLCAALAQPVESDELPGLITQAALRDHCPHCTATLEIFVSVYGAAAGNLALTAYSTGGVYLGGGIAPRILPALRWPVFLESFRAKAPLEALMQNIPVKVILNREAGLLGAAAFAARLAG